MDHDHICKSCLKPKKKKKNKGYNPTMHSDTNYFYRNRRKKEECEMGCGAMVVSQEAHASTKHFCSFCSRVFRKIVEHNESRHLCSECEELVEEVEPHKQEVHIEN